ncbi:hypothetical protein MMC25_001193 [Agyrium rufum]|nr:hypothetical protein [Agyrium rufum]
MDTNTQNPISADEIALYDRQIRLWGVQAQENGLGTEIAKNLVLAGIGSLTIQDDLTVTEEDLASQFFISEENIGMNRAEAALPAVQRLNPRVKLATVITPILAIAPEAFTPFSLIIATDLPFATLSTINTSCRFFNKPFYAGCTYGFYGFIFADLIQHTYLIEREKSNVPTKIGPETTTRKIITSTTKKADNGKTIEVVTKEEIYSPLILANTSPLPAETLKNRRRKLHVTPLLSCLRALSDFQSTTSRLYPSHTSGPDLQLFTSLVTDKHKELQLPPETLRSEFLRAFLQNLGAELAPVTAMLGGQLAQDVINVIGGREQPIQNFCCFDGDSSIGPVYSLHPIFEPLELEKDVLASGSYGMMNGNGVGGSTVVETNGTSNGLGNGHTSGSIEIL